MTRSPRSMLKKATSHPAQPRARETCTCPELRSRLVGILNVPPREGARLGALGMGVTGTPAVPALPAALLREGARLGALGAGGCNCQPF
jgi:hypothetical protein